MTFEEGQAVAMRLVLASLDQDHDMRIRTLHEINDPDELRTLVDVLAHVAAKSWLEVL